MKHVLVCRHSNEPIKALLPFSSNDGSLVATDRYIRTTVQLYTDEAFALTHFSVCSGVYLGSFCVFATARVEAKCGCGPLALVQFADTSYD